MKSWSQARLGIGRTISFSGLPFKPVFVGFLSTGGGTSNIDGFALAGFATEGASGYGVFDDGGFARSMTSVTFADDGFTLQLQPNDEFYGIEYTFYAYGI